MQIIRCQLKQTKEIHTLSKIIQNNRSRQILSNGNSIVAEEEHNKTNLARFDLRVGKAQRRSSAPRPDQFHPIFRPGMLQSISIKTFQACNRTFFRFFFLPKSDERNKQSNNQPQQTTSKQTTHFALHLEHILSIKAVIKLAIDFNATSVICNCRSSHVFTICFSSRTPPGRKAKSKRKFDSIFFFGKSLLYYGT